MKLHRIDDKAYVSSILVFSNLVQHLESIPSWTRHDILQLRVHRFTMAFIVYQLPSEK